MRGRARTRGIAQSVLATNRRGRANRLTSGGKAVAWRRGPLGPGLLDSLQSQQKQVGFGAKFYYLTVRKQPHDSPFSDIQRLTAPLHHSCHEKRRSDKIVSANSFTTARSCKRNDAPSSNLLHSLFTQVTVICCSTCLNSGSPVTRCAFLCFASAAAKASANDILFLDLK